jgi:uncharacterized protein
MEKNLNSSYKGNWKVIEASLLLHEFTKDDPNGSREFLKNFSEGEIKNVIHCIDAHYWARKVKPKTIEAKIVQDCDSLDMLGAIGIARAFMAGGEKGLDLIKAENEYKNKRLIVYSKLNLEESKIIANKKFQFTKLFFETIDKEIKNAGVWPPHFRYNV